MKWSTVFLLLVLPFASHAGGTLQDTSFYSVALDAERNIAIYLPEGYDPDGDTAYPVVYFLHGSSYGYQYYWWSPFQMKASLDTLIAHGEIPPTLVVTPDGLIGPYNGGYWTDSELYGDFERYVVEDVVEYMDTHYRTLPFREYRGIQGLSMGGYGAMKLGLKHPDVFCAIASHSGPIGLDVSVECSREPIMQEYPEYPDGPYNYTPGAGFMSGLMFTRSGAFSPNLDNPTWQVDLPMDEWGEVVDSVMVRWRFNCPCYCARNLSPDHDLAIFFDCGIYDEYCAYEAALAFRDTLDALGVPYDFEEFYGGHSDQFIERFRVGIKRLMQTIPSSIDDDPRALHAWDGIRLTGANPFFEHTSVGFDLSVAERVRLTVHDARGRLVRTLVDGPMPAGGHSVRWSGVDDGGKTVPSGVYLVRFRTEQGESGRGRVVAVR